MATKASAPAPSAPSLTPWNQALSVAVSSANSWNTANSQTGQIFQNATTWPYTKTNADSITSGGQSTVNPSSVSPSTAQNFTPNSVWAFTQQNGGNVQAWQQAFQGFRNANTTPQPILPIAQRTNLTPNAMGGNITPIKPLWGMTGAPDSSWITGKQNTAVTPVSPVQNFGQSTKQITSTLGATKDDQDFLNKSFTQFTPLQQAEWNAMSQQHKLDSSKALLQGYRDTRDASMTKENLDYNHDLTANAKTAQFQADVQQAQRNIATTNQNMALVTGMSGPLRSSDVASATSNAIANAQATYNNLVRSNTYEMAQLSNNYHMATKSLLNQYNDRVNSSTQKLLSDISALDATGEFGTKLGLLKGQDLIDQALNDNLNSQQFLADRMNMMSKIAVEQQTQQLALAKWDNDMTKSINDGFVHNAQWTILKDAQGNPMKAQIQMSDQEKMNQQYAQALKLKQMELDQGNYAPDGMGGIFNKRTGQTTYGNSGTNTAQVNPSSVSPQSIVSLNPRLQGNNVQCGQPVNDYITSSWVKNVPAMWDSYDSKINTVKAIWSSNIPQVWGVFVWNTWSSTGHTGIVQSVNSDGTFVATDANAKWSPNGWPLTSTPYKVTDKFTFSQPLAPTQTNQSTQENNQTISLPWVDAFINNPSKANRMLAMQSLNQQGIHGNFDESVSKYKENQAVSYGIPKEVYEKLAPTGMNTEHMLTAQSIANLDGDASFVSMKSGDREKVMNAATLINPNITQNILKRYSDIVNPSSNNYKTIQGANTAFGHMSELADIMKWMTWQTDIQKVNAIKQWVSNNTGSPEYTNVATVMNTLAPELAKIYKPNVTDSEIEAFSKQLSPTMSPDQMVSGLKTQINLTSSKLETLADTFRKDGKLVSPKVLDSIYLDWGKEALNNLWFNIDESWKIVKTSNTSSQSIPITNSSWESVTYHKYF